MADTSIEQLANEWLRRLETAEPFRPAVPQEGLFPEETRRLSDLYQKLRPYSPDSPIASEFYERYRTHADKARSILSEVLPTVQERFKQFSKNTGITDYDPIEKYASNQIAGLIGSGQHEIYAHELPYAAGFMPDYRGFSAGVGYEGNPVIMGPNSVTPYNENVAILGGDEAFRSYLLGKDVDPSMFRGAFNDYFVKELKESAPVDEESRAQLDTRTKAFYPSSGGQQLSEEYKSTADKAGKLFLEKYVKPAASQFEGVIRTQFPGLAEQRNLIYSPGEYQQILNLLDRDLAKGRPFASLGDFYFSQDPVSVASKGLTEFGRALRRTPSALLPGVADLIPSPEAVKTGYAQGPTAMGKQMGREFLQSLPTSIAAAGALATPVLAPSAPGIGAGLIGTAGARALNEVVRQETGEGIVPKLRQAIGTAPRTGAASPQRTTPAPLTQQIKPLTSEQRAELRRQQNRNEIRRRMELAQQRFNPRRGEFGLSELLFGR